MILKEKINNKINNLEKTNEISNYLLNASNHDEKIAIMNFDTISEHDIILNEFIEVVTKKTMDIENPIIIEGYSAKDISNITKKYNYVDIYCSMTILKNDPERFKLLLDLQETLNNMNS